MDTLPPHLIHWPSSLSTGRVDRGRQWFVPPSSVLRQTVEVWAVVSEFSRSSAWLPAAVPVDSPYTFKCCSLAL